jgi:hypothetical protein
MSLQELATAPEAAAPAKQQRISKRLAEAVRLITTGECATQKAAAERVGMNYTHLCEAMKKPHVRVFIERRARETIAAGMMRASARLNQLVDAASEHVSFDASKHVLALAGIKPSPDTQVSVNIELKAGYVLDLREPASMPHTPTIEGNALKSQNDV